jgi:uncharacterized membrane protein YgaE (UPF0421/DUF939 family)
MGAMVAMEPTFRESFEACLTQVIGVLFGAVTGLLLFALRIPPLVAMGIGIVLVIVLYNGLKIRFSPTLACFIVVTLCIDPGLHPVTYALERLWDTAIGLAVGMAINMLVFPYDNSRHIRTLVKNLDRGIIAFLEDLFDGDQHIPDAREVMKQIDELDRQLMIFSNQRLVLRLRRQKEQLEQFRICEGKARELLSRLIVLSRAEKPGILNEESRRLLQDCGAEIRDQRTLTDPTELDMVTNYHIRKILLLRDDLLNELESWKT